MPGAGLEWLISTVNEGAEMGSLKVVLVLLRAMLIPKVHLAVENLALRQQLAVCKQSVKRPKLRLRDRVFTDTRGVPRDRHHQLAWLAGLPQPVCA